MANPPCLPEDSIQYYKPKDPTQKEQGISFFASIFSLIIYIFVFYIFNLSPYTLLNNYIFWFLLSNNLILIIAVDYGVFSSSKQKHDPYDQYHVSSYVPNYPQLVDKKCISPKQEMGGEMPQEVNKYIITETIEFSEQQQQQSLVPLGIEVPEHVIETVVQNEPKKPSEECSNVKKPLLPLEVDDSYRACEEKPVPDIIYQRSKSDRAHRSKRVVNDENMKRRKRSAAMKVEAKVDEENEFNNMTIEELNRRVEEFIHKFNRQIRLQAIRDVHQIDDEK
ncbi:hypothetical protein E2542_SST16904 [Spatholobus suberectus]|nr:hypothetical protein E2542_SST16904 [Spatholobus suberectus]